MRACAAASAHQGAHARQQLLRQRKVPKVVGADLHLEAVLCVLQRAHHDARIQDLRARTRAFISAGTVVSIS